MSTTRHLALLGGFRNAPEGTAPDTYMIAALIGGANLDLSATTIPPGGVTITKWSLVGGAHVRVPEGCRVEVTGFNLVGRRHTELSHTTPDGPLIRIRAFGAWGGVHVED